MKTSPYKNIKSLSIFLAILLFALGVYLHSIDNFLAYRGLRGFTCFAYLGLIFFTLRDRINFHLAVFLLFYGTSSFATIWYENNMIAILSTILNVISFLLLIWALLPKVNFRKMNKPFLIGFILVMLVNGYLLYRLIEMISNMSLSNTHLVLLAISTMALLFVGFLTLLYNHEYSTKGTVIFLMFVFQIIFAEVFRALAYYDLAYGNAAVHIARILLLGSMISLLNYSLAEKTNAEMLNS